MQTEAGPTDAAGAKPGRLNGLLAALIALKLVILFVFAWKIRLVMDEFVFLGNAKYLFDGAYETYWPAKAFGYALFFKLAHVTGWDATSILLVGRFQTALLGCATVAMTYACARALGVNRTRALAIVLVLLSFSNFMERIFRTIAEPVALFFAVAALLVVVRARPVTSRAIVLAGALSGLSFLATQKSVYFNFALGVALVADAALARRYLLGIQRGAWLVLGWTLPLIAYCLFFAPTNPLPIAENLFVGPTEIAFRGGGDYGGLRQYVVQILIRNAALCALCFAGILLALRHVGKLPEARRIALIFSLVITVLVFAHDQPWPYVFIMALPFMALWVLVPLDRIAGNRTQSRLGWIVLGGAIAVSFVSNVRYLRIDNPAQLELVARAEAMLGPDEKYFDGIAMLPNRKEPSTLWLDRHFIIRTLREGAGSEAYRILADDPPKMIIWSKRMGEIHRVIAPVFDDSYVAVAPNVRLAGHRLTLGEAAIFKVPIAGTYRLYDATGRTVQGRIEVDGKALGPRVRLTRGVHPVILRAGADEALLVLEGSYAGLFAPGPDNLELFEDVYN